MKKFNRLLKFYSKKGVHVNGYNLEESNSTFSSLDKVIPAVAYYLESHKIFNELVAKYGKDQLSSDFKHEKQVKLNELNQKFNAGEIVLDPQLVELIKMVENFYAKLLESDFQAESLKVKQKQVVLNDKLMIHSCNIASIKDLESYSKLGIVASEFFGELESEHEGRFCVFLKKFDKTQACSINEVRFILDPTNIGVAKLLALDFFEFAKKFNHNEDVGTYPAQIRELYEKLIYPLSPAGKSWHEERFKKFENYNWLAIPGGIPPQFFSGIQINSKNEDLMKNLDVISNMFPNLIVFDENCKYLAGDLNKKEFEREML